MHYWKKARIPFLIAIFGSVFFVLGKSIFAPSITRYSSPDSFIFPANVPLTGWQPLANRPLPESNSESLPAIAQTHYQYKRDGLILDIEMRYFTNTNGNVRGFIRDRTAIEPSLTIRQHERIGFYGVVVSQQRAYLSACINPRGGSTVEEGQFRQNRYRYDVQLNRLLPWLLGREPLQDNRCLWAHLSVPVEKSSPETAYQRLEDVWVSWYEWWYPRFPNISNSN